VRLRDGVVLSDVRQAPVVGPPPAGNVYGFGGANT